MTKYKTFNADTSNNTKYQIMLGKTIDIYKEFYISRCYV